MVWSFYDRNIASSSHNSNLASSSYVSRTSCHIPKCHIPKYYVQCGEESYSNIASSSCAKKIASSSCNSNTASSSYLSIWHHHLKYQEHHVIFLNVTFLSIMCSVAKSRIATSHHPVIWGEVGGWGRVPFSRNLMSPTPRRKWYLTTGRKFH